MTRRLIYGLSERCFWLCDAREENKWFGAPFYSLWLNHAVKTGTVTEIDDPTKKPDKDTTDAVADAIKDGEKEKPKTVHS